MIPRSAPLRQIPVWQNELSRAVSDLKTLLEIVQLDTRGLRPAARAHESFRLRVPHSYIERMEKGNPSDPLLLQILPTEAELLDTPGFSHDPLNESAYMPHPGILHKYKGRVLIIVTSACAVHCRYCFRRHFPYTDANPSPDHWRKTLDYIAKNKQIHEVILSGGDPLSLNDERLEQLIHALNQITHLRRIRIHTRLPVVLPRRVDSQLTQWIKGSSKQIVFVLHINHPNELDASLREALNRLTQSQAILLNQAVLLRNINDKARVQIELSEALLASGVMPYYLHQLDPVTGTAHFQVSDEKAMDIWRKVHHTLPGYMVPRLVREKAGGSAKEPLFCPVLDERQGSTD